MSHLLTPNNSSIKSRGPVGEEQEDVSEQLLNLTVDVTEISEAVHRQSRKLAELVCELINLLLVTVLLLLLAFVYMNLFLCLFKADKNTAVPSSRYESVECNLLSHKRVGVTLQATVEKLYEKQNTEVCEC